MVFDLLQKKGLNAKVIVAMANLRVCQDLLFVRIVQNEEERVVKEVTDG